MSTGCPEDRTLRAWIAAHRLRGIFTIRSKTSGLTLVRRMKLPLRRWRAAANGLATEPGPSGRRTPYESIPP